MLVPIGTIIGAHGIRGLVKVKTQRVDFLKVIVEENDLILEEKTIKAAIKGATSSPYIVQISGLESREDAEKLKGKKLYINQSIGLEKTSEMTFAADNLIGFAVEESQINTGKITNYHNFGAGDILEVEFQTGTSEMFAFDKNTFPEIDLKNRLVKLIRPVEI